MQTIHLYYEEGRWQASGVSARLLAAYMPELVVYDGTRRCVCPPIEEIIIRFKDCRMLVADEHIEIYPPSSPSSTGREPSS